MTTQKMAPHLKKCKRLILEGKRGEALAKGLGVSTRTVYNYTKQLEYMGEIIDITGDKHSTPRIYEDGRARVFYNSKFAHQNEDSQITEKDPENNEFSKRGVGSTPILHTEEIPTNCVRFHCTGCYEVPIIRLGDHAGRIVDTEGRTLGQWSNVANCTGSRRQYGKVRLYPNEDLHFTLYYVTHPQPFEKITVTPNPRNVYYKMAKKQGPILLEEQVNALLDVLTVNHGWIFDRPVFKGTYHFALTSPNLAPLLQLADKDTDRDDCRLHIDTSEGSPEIEFYSDPNGDMDQAQEDVINVQELPVLLAGLKESVGQIYGTLRIVASSVGELTKITTELTKVQAQIIETAANLNIREFDGRGYQ